MRERDFNKENIDSWHKNDLEPQKNQHTLKSVQRNTTLINISKTRTVIWDSIEDSDITYIDAVIKYQDIKEENYQSLQIPRCIDQ